MTATLTSTSTSDRTTAAARPVAPTLPRRPRLLRGLPVLRRAPGEVQIGTDLRHALVISGVPATVTPVLSDLTGTHTTDELLARAGPPDRPVLRDILTGLAGLGLLEDADRPGPPFAARLTADRTAWTLRAGPQHTELAAVRQRAVVAVYGSGRVGVAVAALLAAAGIGWLHVAADGVVQAEDTGGGYLDADVGRPRVDAARAAVHRAASGVRTDPLPARVRPDLVVLADLIVPDPVLLASLVAEGVPHLPARAAEGTGLVGPLVLPGQTCCLRCVDLHTAEADDCWPFVAAQLVGSSRPADLASAQATAAFAAGQVLRLLHGSPGGHDELATRNGAIELDTFAGESRRVALAAHPRCGCAAGSRMITESGGDDDVLSG